MTTKDAIKYFESYLESFREDGMGLPSEEPFLLAIKTLKEKEKQHNDVLRNQGKLSELPCAVGGSIYVVLPDFIYDDFGNITGIKQDIAKYKFSLEWLNWLDDFGKTIFLTEEEAKAASERE